MRSIRQAHNQLIYRSRAGLKASTNFSVLGSCGPVVLPLAVSTGFDGFPDGSGLGGEDFDVDAFAGDDGEEFAQLVPLGAVAGGLFA